MDNIFSQLAIDLHGVIALILDPEVLINRIKARRTCGSCGNIVNLLVDAIPADGSCPVCSSELVHRADDNDEVVRRRIKGYRGEMAPLMAYYESRGLLYPIDGLGTVAEVAGRVGLALERIKADADARAHAQLKEKV